MNVICLLRGVYCIVLVLAFTRYLIHCILYNIGWVYNPRYRLMWFWWDKSSSIQKRVPRSAPRLKGTVYVISSNSPCTEWQIRFITIFLKAVVIKNAWDTDVLDVDIWFFQLWVLFKIFVRNGGPWIC